jgi:hypothetical protein
LRAHAEARGPDGGDDGAPAEGGLESIGLDLFTELGQPLESEEDQIFKRFPGADQAWP